MIGVKGDSVSELQFPEAMLVPNDGRCLAQVLVENNISIQEGDFSAQDARIVRVASDVTIEPTEIELSLQKNGRRLELVSVQNGSPLQKTFGRLSLEYVKILKRS